MNRVPLTVARTEFRRTVRSILGNWTKLLLFGLSALVFLGPVLVFGTLFFSVAGEELATDAPETVGGTSISDGVAGVTALFLVFMTVTASIRSVTNVANVDEPACLLISTSVSNVVVGVVAAELALFAFWLVPPSLILAAGFSYGAGTVVPLLFAPFFVCLLLAIAVPIGFLVGVCLRHLVTVYEPLATRRTEIVVGLSVGYIALIGLGWIDSVIGLLFQLLADSPLGWPGHLLLVVVPNVSFSVLGIVGTVTGTLVVVPVVLGAGIRVANYHWFSDPAQEDDEVFESDATDRLETTLRTVVSQPVETVAVTAVRRTRRAPIRLLYVAYPLIGSLFFIEDVAQSGTLPAYVAVVLCLYVVWGAGALFSLNPLGDFGPAMPAVLTSTISGRDAISGTVLAGVLVATPVAFVVSVAVGIISPLSGESTAALVTASVVASVASPALATGIGTLFPRFGSVRIATNRKAVMPSKTAFLAYSAAVLLPAGAAALLYVDLVDLVAEFLTGLLSLLPGLSLTVPVWGVAGFAWVLLGVGLVAPLVSVVYAMRAFDSFRPY